MRFLNDVQGELLVLGLVIVAKLVLRLAIWSLIISEPCPDLVYLSWEFPASQSARMQTQHTFAA